MKHALLSTLYIVVVAGALLAFDFALEYVMNNWIFELLDWFNAKSFWFKFIMLILAGSATIYLIAIVLGIVATALNRLLLSWFPLTTFNLIASMIISYANAIFCIVTLWQVPASYNFWIVIELLMLSWLIFALNNAVVLRTEKERYE